MIHERFRATGAYDAVQGLSDLFNIRLQNDGVQDFDVPNFLLEQLKNYQGGKNLTQRPLRDTTTCKDMHENAVSDTVNWQTRQWRHETRLQVLAWMIINSRRMNLNQLENYQKVCSQIVLQCFVFGTNWYTRHLMVRLQACKISHKMDSGM